MYSIRMIHRTLSKYAYNLTKFNMKKQAGLSTTTKIDGPISSNIDTSQSIVDNIDQHVERICRQHEYDTAQPAPAPSQIAASARAICAEYKSYDTAQRIKFVSQIVGQWSIDYSALSTTAAKFAQKVDSETASALARRLRLLSEPKYISLIRAIGNLRQGIRFLIDMRADILCSTVPIATKPCITFAGDAFQTDSRLIRVRNFLTDYFRLENVDNLNLPGVQLAVCFTAVGTDLIQMRVYRIHLKKSGTSTPRAELTEMGPRADMKLRREVMASADLMKTANKQPRAAKVKKRKNMSKDVFGSQLGRVHVGKQDLKRLQTRKVKALKKEKADKKSAS